MLVWSCKRNIYFSTSGNSQRIFNVDKPDFSKFSKETKITRSNENCFYFCYLYNLARTLYTKKNQSKLQIKHRTFKKNEAAIKRCNKLDTKHKEQLLESLL